MPLFLITKTALREPETGGNIKLNTNDFYPDGFVLGYKTRLLQELTNDENVAL